MDKLANNWPIHYMDGSPRRTRYKNSQDGLNDLMVDPYLISQGEDKMNNNEPKIVTKPWGREEWLSLNEKYCYKKIVMNAGHKSSLQYHENKLETNYILSGKALITMYPLDSDPTEPFEVGPGDFFTVIPLTVHRVEAIEDYVALEVSTPEVDDVIRLEDDAGRGSGRIQSEHA